MYISMIYSAKGHMLYHVVSLLALLRTSLWQAVMC